jgi:light-regulated signal transduction histidine kinase (bacteriophytochrome)
MDQLIDGILGLSRLARTRLQRTVVDLSAVAETIAWELRSADPERRVEFVVPPGIVANADATLLGAALRNLMGNAWKFTAKHACARIEVGTTRHEGETAYFVRDDGAGFDMAYADQLFGAFQRLHTPAEFEGTGIGLTTVKRIVRRHGGRIWAQAEVEKGATFFFTLPVNPRGSNEQKPDTAG